MPDPGLSLTIHNVAAPPYGLAIGFAWWIPGFVLALAYSIFVYRHFRGKVTVSRAADADPVTFAVVENKHN